MLIPAFGLALAGLALAIFVGLPQREEWRQSIEMFSNSGRVSEHQPLDKFFAKRLVAWPGARASICLGDTGTPEHISVRYLREYMTANPSSHSFLLTQFATVLTYTENPEESRSCYACIALLLNDKHMSVNDWRSILVLGTAVSSTARSDRRLAAIAIVVRFYPETIDSEVENEFNKFFESGISPELVYHKERECIREEWDELRASR